MPRKILGRPHKHSRGASEERDEAFDGIEMVDLMDEIVVLRSSPQVFDMDAQLAREQLARAAWDRSIKINDSGSLRTSNPAITRLLDTVCANSYRDRAPNQRCQDVAEQRIESILSFLVRIQSQKKLTVLCMRFSLACYRIQLDHDLWQMVHGVAPGLLASLKWTDDFILFAMPFRPPPIFQTLPGVGACMFDNYTRKVLYKSQATTESSGYRLDMTNSMSMAVPRHCASEQFDAAAIGASARPQP